MYQGFLLKFGGVYCCKRIEIFEKNVVSSKKKPNMNSLLSNLLPITAPDIPNYIQFPLLGHINIKY